MKRFFPSTPTTALCGAIMAFSLLAAAPISTSAQGKFGTVDMTKVFEKYYKTKQADGRIREFAADADKTRKTMLDEYRKANEDYKKLIEGANDQAVSAEERDRRKKNSEAKLTELQEIERSYQQYMRETDARLTEQKKRLRDGIVREIRDLVNDKAKAGSYTMVLDVSGESKNNDLPFILYQSGINDLTEEIITELNVSAPPGSLDPLPDEKSTNAIPANPLTAPAKASPTPPTARPPVRK